MALTAIFYNFSKRANSTKVPDANVSGTTYNVVLKMPTSRRQPTLRISADTFNFNYCRFEGSYYFVEDIVSVRENLFDVTMRKDVLGTFRAQILAQNAYVMYDTEANTEVVDNRLAVNTNFTVSSADAEMPELEGNGVYSVCVIGRDSTDSWIVDNVTDLTNLIDSSFRNIFNPQLPPTQPTVMEQLKVSLDYIMQVISQLLSSGDAPKCIRSCYWIPWGISGDSGGTIYLGNFQSSVTGSRVTRNNTTYTYTVSIPWQCNDWRRNSPYTQVYLYLPFIGLVNIPSAAVSKWAQLGITYVISKRTGEVSVRVNASDQVIGIYQGNSGTVVPIGESNITPAARTTGLIQAAGAAATMASGGAALGGAAALAGLMGGMASIMAGAPSCIGSASGGTDAGLPRLIRCFTVFHDTNVAPASVSDVIGTPTFARKRIGSVSGYIQTHEYAFEGEALREDYEEINNYLNGGAFIE